MPNTKNIETIKNLRTEIADINSMIFIDYKGLAANQVNEFRQAVKETQAHTTVIKNTLLKKALKEENIDVTPLESVLTGSTAVVFTDKDAIASIKVMADFEKKTGLPKVKAAIIEGIFTTAKQVTILSTLPSKEQLLTQVVCGLKSPITGIVNVLIGPQQRFVNVLDAISKKTNVKKEEV